jgi:hypothetical protein
MASIDTSSLEYTETGKNNTPNSNSNSIKTYRFEFSKSFIDELSRFSKVHQYDERRAYKEAWVRWKSNIEISEIISVEVRRLESIGYMGDIEDKMFKSGRYYFRKKSIKQNNNQNIEDMKSETANDNHDPAQDNDDVSQDTDTTTPSSRTTNNGENAVKPKQERRPYITMSKSCIRLMDDHIKMCSSQPDFKPSTSYDNFYNEKMSTPQMMDEIKVIVGKYERSLQKTGTTSPAQPIPLETIIQEIMDKVKKTYKNRYYRFASKE